MSGPYSHRVTFKLDGGGPLLALGYAADREVGNDLYIRESLSGKGERKSLYFPGNECRCGKSICLERVSSYEIVTSGFIACQRREVDVYTAGFG